MSKILKYNIKAVRADKCIQIKELCNVCRFHRQTYYRWENILMDSSKSIPADSLKTIADYFQMPVDDLFKKQTVAA